MFTKSNSPRPAGTIGAAFITFLLSVIILSPIETAAQEKISFEVPGVSEEGFFTIIKPAFVSAELPSIYVNKNKMEAISNWYEYSDLLFEYRCKYKATFHTGIISVELIDKQYRSTTGWEPNVLPMSKKRKKKLLGDLESALTEMGAEYPFEEKEMASEGSDMSSDKSASATSKEGTIAASDISTSEASQTSLIDPAIADSVAMIELDDAYIPLLYITAGGELMALVNGPEKQQPVMVWYMPSIEIDPMLITLDDNGYPTSITQGNGVAKVIQQTDTTMALAWQDTAGIVAVERNVPYAFTTVQRTYKPELPEMQDYGMAYRPDNILNIGGTPLSTWIKRGGVALEAVSCISTVASGALPLAALTCGSAIASFAQLYSDDANLEELKGNYNQAGDFLETYWDDLNDPSRKKTKIMADIAADASMKKISELADPVGYIKDEITEVITSSVMNLVAHIEQSDEINNWQDVMDFVKGHYQMPDITPLYPKEDFEEADYERLTLKWKGRLPNTEESTYFEVWICKQGSYDFSPGHTRVNDFEVEYINDVYGKLEPDTRYTWRIVPVMKGVRYMDASKRWNFKTSPERNQFASVFDRNVRSVTVEIWAMTDYQVKESFNRYFSSEGKPTGWVTENYTDTMKRYLTHIYPRLTEGLGTHVAFRINWSGRSFSGYQVVGGSHERYTLSGRVSADGKSVETVTLRKEYSWDNTSSSGAHKEQYTAVDIPVVLEKSYENIYMSHDINSITDISYFSTSSSYSAFDNSLSRKKTVQTNFLKDPFKDFKISVVFR